jgi:hypothetical protein
VSSIKKKENILCMQVKNKSRVRELENVFILGSMDSIVAKSKLLV